MQASEQELDPIPGPIDADEHERNHAPQPEWCPECYDYHAQYEQPLSDAELLREALTYVGNSEGERDYNWDKMRIWHYRTSTRFGIEPEPWGDPTVPSHPLYAPNS